MAEIPGDDGTVGAFTGIHEGQGGETGTPLFVRLPLVSYGTAFSICLAGSSALLERNQSGMGQKVVVPLYSGSAIIQATSFIDGLTSQRQEKDLQVLPEAYQRTGYINVSMMNGFLWHAAPMFFGTKCVLL